MRKKNPNKRDGQKEVEGEEREITGGGSRKLKNKAEPTVRG